MSGLMLGLQGLPLGKRYGYGADVEQMGEAVAAARQNLRRLVRLQEMGRTEAPSGRNLAECIAVCTAKLTVKEAAYERAVAEL